MSFNVLNTAARMSFILAVHMDAVTAFVIQC